MTVKRKKIITDEKVYSFDLNYCPKLWLDIEPIVHQTGDGKIIIGLIDRLGDGEDILWLSRALYGADFHQKKMTNYSILSFTLNVNLFRYLGFQVGLKNVLGQEYQTFYNYPMPGRMITFDVNYKL